VQRSATAGADLRVDFDPDLFARQMIGKRLAPRLYILRLSTRLRGFSAGYVGLEVLQSECELVSIDALGPAAKLRALKLLDDQLEPFDLIVALLDLIVALRDGRRHLTCEALQQGRVGRKIVEIEMHDDRMQQPR
jgi:hypothetical protein